jgi:hypothetical protein
VVDFRLGSVPAGAGYTLTLTASSPDGRVSCLGASAPFTVVEQNTVVEQVQLVCASDTQVSQGGPINWTESFCGSWQSVTATNGGTAAANGAATTVLTATATAPDTAAIAYNWSVLASTGGGVTLGALTGNGTNTGTVAVTCNQSTQNGGATIQLVVTDSPDGGPVTCPATLSTTTVNVSCTAAN